MKEKRISTVQQLRSTVELSNRPADFSCLSRQLALTTPIVTRLWIPARFVTLQTTSKAWHAPMC
jgi:hypothetical protein